MCRLGDSDSSLCLLAIQHSGFLSPRAESGHRGSAPVYIRHTTATSSLPHDACSCCCLLHALFHSTIKPCLPVFQASDHRGQVGLAGLRVDARGIQTAMPQKISNIAELCSCNNERSSKRMTERVRGDIIQPRSPCILHDNIVDGVSRQRLTTLAHQQRCSST